MSTKINRELDRFIAESSNRRQNNEWLYGDGISVYVRKSVKVAPFFDFRSFVICLDIANIQVDEENQNTGVFTDFLSHALKVNPWPLMCVENVMTKRFASYFRRRGWHELSVADTPSFYWNCTKE